MGVESVDGSFDDCSGGGMTIDGGNEKSVFNTDMSSIISVSPSVSPATFMMMKIISVKKGTLFNGKNKIRSKEH